MSNLVPVKTYPNFVANQVLTNTQLNNLREYLDTQNRLTRIRLIGTGIVCGLSARFEDGQLIISEGYGVTSDGYLIELAETRYDQHRSYQDSFTQQQEMPLYPPFLLDEEEMIPLRELISDPDPDDYIDLPDAPATPLTANFLEDKVLILYLEKQPRDLKSCFTTDCNNKGEEVNLCVRVLLAEQADLAELEQWVDPANDCNEHPVYLQMLRPFVVPGNLMPDIDDPATLIQPYQELATIVKEELADQVEDLFTDTLKADLNLWNYQDRVDGLRAQIDAVLATAPFTQYHYDYIHDLVDAYNEFTAHYCEVIRPCCPTSNFPCHLVVRNFTDDLGQGYDEDYRHHFLPSPIVNVLHRDLEKARKLFKRLLFLAESFLLPEEPAIKITPSQPEDYPFDQRAIPFYYQMTTALAQLWPPRVCCVPLSLSYAANKMSEVAVNNPRRPAYLKSPLHFNLNQHHFLRIEGHRGRLATDAYDEIQKIRTSFNLEFCLHLLPLEQPAITEDETNLFDIISAGFDDLRGAWQEFFARVDRGDYTPEDFELLREKTAEIQQVIVDRHAEWCQFRGQRELFCNIDHLQADYLQLRTELLCLLRRAKGIFADLPEVDFGGGGSVSEYCATLNDLPENTAYGNNTGMNFRPGDVVFTDSNIVFTAEVLLSPDGSELFHDATLIRDNSGDQFLSLKGIGLGFTLPEPANEVRIPMQARIQNLAINDGQLLIDNDIIEQFNGQEVAPGVTLQFSQNNPDRPGELRLTGNGIRSVRLAGDGQFYEFCPRSTTGLTAIDIPNIYFSSRFVRYQQLCELLEQTTGKNAWCLHLPLLRDALKDISGAIIELKLLLGILLDSVNGIFQPYAAYPEWNDLMQTLDSLHFTCLYPRFSTLYYALDHHDRESRPQLRRFARRHSGLAHRAGVPKGGTFVLVYRNEEDNRVIADFSLEHCVHDCCPCEVDTSDLCLPPVALPDYVLHQLEGEGEPVEIQIPISINDFDQNKAQPLQYELVSDRSDRDADLQLFTEEDGTVYVLYQLRKASWGVDHFAYRAVDPICKLEDIGHVYVGISLPPGQSEGPPPVEDGTITGSVIYSDAFETTVNVQGATVRLLDANGNELARQETNDDGQFRFTAAPGDYGLIAAMNCYRGRSENNTINENAETDVGRIPLLRIPYQPAPQTESKRIRDDDIRAGETLTLTPDNEYLIDGLVFVEKGATLVIRPGTVIRAAAQPSTGDPTSALIITRGGKILADGQPGAPIIFTSEFDDLQTPDDLTAREQQLWGGLLILGNAPIGTNIDPTTGFATATIEGLPRDDTRAIYGGDDPRDSSGVLRYVSIRHGGAFLEAESQINGLTLAGVGSGTVVEYVEVFACRDDGIEVFGGTVNMKYMVAAFCGDDSFDFDQSWNGTVQFLFAIQLPDQGQMLVEYEGSEARDMQPRTIGRIYNGTFIGAGLQSNNRSSAGVLLRNDGAAAFWNCIWLDLPNYVFRVDNTSQQRLKDREIQFNRNIVFNFEALTQGASGPIEVALERGQSEQVNPELISVFREPEHRLDPRPRQGSPAAKDAVFNNNGFVDQVEYRGAFDPGNIQWIRCWTALDHYRYLPKEQETGGVVEREDFFEARFDTHRDVFNATGNSIRDFNATLARDAQNFILAKAGNTATSSDELTDSYNEVSKSLIKSIDAADSRRQQNDLNRMLRMVNHAYFDRLVIENPEKLDPVAEKSITKMVKVMERSSVSLNTLLNEWKSNELKEMVGSDAAIKQIRTILKEG